MVVVVGLGIPGVVNSQALALKWNNIKSLGKVEKNGRRHVLIQTFVFKSLILQWKQGEF